MSTQRINTYEAMFLFPQSAVVNLGGAVDHINELLNRAKAEIISFAKWDERRLAYDIQGNKRGLYFLCYFRAPAERIIGLERDCNLSEQLLRTMILRADLVTEERIQSLDAREQLQDEIKFRATQSTEEADAAAVVTTGASAETDDTAHSDDA